MKKILLLLCLANSLHSMEKTIGLTNVGNSCFMNAALQCMLGLTEFNNHLIATKRQYQSNSISELYIEFLEQTKLGEIVRPEALCKKGWNVIGQDENSQQDAGQFLLELLDRLTHVDLKDQGTLFYPKTRKPINELSCLFNVGLESRLSYEACIIDTSDNTTIEEKDTAISPEVQSGLVLPIGSADVSLYQCLNRFFDGEEVPYTTPVLEQNVMAQKQYKLTETNDFLIINLKRLFSVPIDKTCLFGRHGESIHFPLNGLSLGSKCYKLLGVIMHGGGADGGHYTAYVEKNKEWYYFNDAIIEKTEEKTMIAIAERGYGVNDTTVPATFLYAKE